MPVDVATRTPELVSKEQWEPTEPWQMALLAAAKTIEVGGWVRGHWAKDIGETTRHCAVGALQTAIQKGSADGYGGLSWDISKSDQEERSLTDWPIVQEAAEKLCQHLGIPYGDSATAVGLVEQWNDTLPKGRDRGRYVASQMRKAARQG